MGRWLSPDWSVKAEPVPYAKLDDPQTLNLYAYVGNNPLVRVDKDGHYYCTGTKKQCEELQTALANVQKAIDSGKLNKGEQGALKKVLDFYGPKENLLTDKTKVTVGFAKADANSGAVLWGGRVNVTLNFEAKKSSGGNPTTEMAAATTHEGVHGIQEQKRGNPLSRSQEYAGEQEAYRVQAFINHGLGQDSPYGVWTRKGYSEDNVNYWATQSTNTWCSNGGPNCSQ